MRNTFHFGRHVDVRGAVFFEFNSQHRCGLISIPNRLFRTCSHLHKSYVMDSCLSPDSLSPSVSLCNDTPKRMSNYPSKAPIPSITRKTALIWAQAIRKSTLQLLASVTSSSSATSNLLESSWSVFERNTMHVTPILCSSLASTLRQWPSSVRTFSNKSFLCEESSWKFFGEKEEEKLPLSIAFPWFLYSRKFELKDSGNGNQISMFFF